MNKFISEINIKAYRGLNNLYINNVGRINLLVGNNNSGKSSLLEALKILSQPKEVGLICTTAVSRIPYVQKDNLIDTLITVFQKDPQEDEDNKNMSQMYSICMSCVCNNTNIELGASVCKKDKLLINDGNEEYTGNPTIKVLEGTLKTTLGAEKEYITFSIGEDISVDETEKAYNAVFMPVNVSLYKSCLALYSQVIQEDSKDDFIKVLQIFDENITDISIVEKTIWIHNRVKSTMPLFSYGTGLQKALLLAITIIMAKDGILLIDEIETAIHTSALREVFAFIIKACEELNVQLFATTHSIEVIDKLLEAQEAKLEDIRVITLTNDDVKKKTYSRVLDGKTALDERREYGMELRI